MTLQIVLAIPILGYPKLQLFRFGPLHHDWPCYTGIMELAILSIFSVGAVIRITLFERFVIRSVTRK